MKNRAGKFTRNATGDIDLRSDSAGAEERLKG